MLFKENLGRVAARAVAGLVALVALASCGGGTFQVTPFIPARILTFGDENSLLVGQEGLKYSINAISTATDQIDCSASPLWNQVLANSYGIVYANCNVEAVADPQAFNFATVGATVDDVATQVAAFQAGDQFNSNDLVTIWVGQNDVINDYQANGGTGDTSSLVTDMKASGQTLAGIVNAVAATGAKVLLLTIPDMADSPRAYIDQQLGDFDRMALLNQMSEGFNNSLRANIVNDGSKIGLVLVDDFTHSAVANPGAYSLLSNPGQSYGCLDSSPLPSCTDNTLNLDPDTNTTSSTVWLWSDPTHLAPTAHLQIGNQAVSRAHSNPF